MLRGGLPFVLREWEEADRDQRRLRKLTSPCSKIGSWNRIIALVESQRVSLVNDSVLFKRLSLTNVLWVCKMQRSEEVAWRVNRNGLHHLNVFLKYSQNKKIFNHFLKSSALQNFVFSIFGCRYEVLNDVSNSPTRTYLGAPSLLWFKMFCECWQESSR